MRTYNKFKNELNEELRYYKITSVILKLAQRTTAGLMLKFLNDVRKLKNLSEE
jgi:phospholipase C